MYPLLCGKTATADGANRGRIILLKSRSDVNTSAETAGSKKIQMIKYRYGEKI